MTVITVLLQGNFLFFIRDGLRRKWDYEAYFSMNIHPKTQPYVIFKKTTAKPSLKMKKVDKSSHKVKSL